MMRRATLSEIGRSHFFLLAVLGVLFVTLSIVFMNDKIDRLLDEKYQAESLALRKNLSLLISGKSDAMQYIGHSLSKDPRLKDALEGRDVSLDYLKGVSDSFASTTDLKHLWFQVIDANGTSIYRSWTQKRGDSLYQARLDVREMLEEPRYISSISTGKYDLTFKSMTAIYDGAQFIGIFEVIAKFDSIVGTLRTDGVDSVLLVDKSYRYQLKFPFTNRFVDDYYVVNREADRKLVGYAVSNDLMHGLQTGRGFLVDADHDLFVTMSVLDDISGRNMAYFLLFRPLGEIDLSDVMQARNSFYGAFALLGLFLLAVFIYVVKMRKAQHIERFNRELESSVAEKTSELRYQQRFLQNVIDGVPDALMVIEQDFSIRLMNRAARTLYELNPVDDLHTVKCHQVSHGRKFPCSGENLSCPMGKARQTKESQTSMHEYVDENGDIHYYEMTATPLFDDKGNVDAVIELGHDITTHLRTQKMLTRQKNDLNHMAHHDALTGLPNRVLFMDRLEHAIALSQRLKKRVAVLFIDLDRFKEINDSFGHGVGDRVLIENARRLKSSLRESDTLSRLSGDEFAIILERLDFRAVAEDIAAKLIGELKEAISIDDMKLYTTASIGITTFPDDGESPEQLLKNADVAMYKAKAKGKNRYECYTEEMTEDAMRRVQLESALRNAIESDEFELYYQPQYDAVDGGIVGFEALVRWNHPERGLVSPLEFIPLAEETGLILAIGEIVMHKAMLQAVEWHRSGIDPGKISINISARQFQLTHFDQVVNESLKRYACRPEWIGFEITEGSIIEDPLYAAALLRRIRNIGIEISVDDFGTGYSSLGYLKQLPLSRLKIDKSFIDELPHDTEDVGITRAVIALANSLGLEVVAEGVEGKAQVDFLVAEGCRIVQGYYFSRPLPAHEAAALVTTQRT